MTGPVVVTGGGGMVGQTVIALLLARGYAVRAVRPALREDLPRAVTQCAVGPFGKSTDFTAALDGATGVIHLAGVAHRTAQPQEHFAFTAEASARLAQAAVRAGVQRLVFASSIKAVADKTDKGVLLSEASPASPKDAYGLAKLHAEAAILGEHSLHGIAVRPPLVHAATAQANMRLLLRLASSPAPLPLGLWDNQRSLIGLRSLALALLDAYEAPLAVSGPFFVCDTPALSIGAIISALRAGMGRAAGLLPAPVPSLLQHLPKLSSLFGSLAADPGAFIAATGWTPQDSVAALAETGAAWAAQRGLR